MFLYDLQEDAINSDNVQKSTADIRPGCTRPHCTWANHYTCIKNSMQYATLGYVYLIIKNQLCDIYQVKETRRKANEVLKLRPLQQKLNSRKSPLPQSTRKITAIDQNNTDTAEDVSPKTSTKFILKRIVPCFAISPWNPDKQITLQTR